MELEPIRRALQEHVPPTWDPDDDEPVVLTGYAIVTEWIDADGKRWVNVLSGNADDQQLPPWTAEGLLGYGHEHVWEWAVDQDGDDE